MDRLADGQMDRPKDIHTEIKRYTVRKTGREAYREKDRKTGLQRIRQKDRHT